MCARHCWDRGRMRIYRIIIYCLSRIWINIKTQHFSALFDTSWGFFFHFQIRSICWDCLGYLIYFELKKELLNQKNIPWNSTILMRAWKYRPNCFCLWLHDVGFKNEYQINFVGRLFYARRFFGAQKFFGAQNWCIDIICNISTLSHTPCSSVLVYKCWIFVCCLECESHFSNMLCWFEVFLMCRVHLKSSSRCNNPDKYIKSITCAKRVQTMCHFNSKAHNTNTQFEIRCIHF